MIKYDNILVTFTEVPDEISLCINCTCCPLSCKNCFEPWLRNNYGKELTMERIKEMLWKHPNVSCICFMGGINDYEGLSVLMSEIQTWGLKVAIYSGHDYIEPTIEPFVDYYKIGPYIEEFGPLNKKTTNQKFYKKENDKWVDITHRFQNEKD